MDLSEFFPEGSRLRRMLSLVGLLVFFATLFFLLRSGPESRMKQLRARHRAESEVWRLAADFRREAADAYQHVLLYKLRGNELHRFQALYAIRTADDALAGLDRSLSVLAETERMAELRSGIAGKWDRLARLLKHAVSEGGRLPLILQQGLPPADSLMSQWRGYDTVELPEDASSPEVDGAGLLVEIDDSVNAIHEISPVQQSARDTNGFFAAANIFHALIFAFLMTLGGVLAWLALRRSLHRSVAHAGGLLGRIARGELPEKVEERQTDFSELVRTSNSLIDYLESASRFAARIGAGDFDHPFQPRGATDTLGNALIEMRDRLNAAAKEEKVRNWINEGHARINDILRRHPDDVLKLGAELTSALVEYLEASQGALFLYDDTSELGSLEMVGAYAFHRQKQTGRRLAVGEGLAGQAFLEGKTIRIGHIQKEHFYISSGLGESKPSSLLIVPLRDEDHVEGVMELASFQVIEDHHVAFAEKTAASIAISLKTARANRRTRELLAETREKAEEMRAQEEELRQNMEELAATQEQMERKNRELERIQQHMAGGLAAGSISQ
jgi:hypothetical protein